MSENEDKPKEEKKEGENPQSSEKLKRYETTIRRRVECEERAFHIVNKLIYGSVEPDYLIECGKLITKENYEDIVEERAISSLCGYPLCEKELKNIPKQKYFISTKSNKVYDITERKNFCSNQCLKASKAFQLQIPDSPVWTRDQEPAATIKLLPNMSTKGIIGTEVVGEPPWRFLQGEIDSLKELDAKKTAASKSRETTSSTKKNDKHQKSVETQSHSSEAKSPPQSSRKESQILLSDAGDKGVINNLERLNIQEAPSKLLANTGPETLQDSKPCAEKPKVRQNKEEEKSVNENSSACEKTKRSEGNLIANKAQANVSQLDRLNMLLAKNKSVLSGMVDIQNTATAKASFKNPPKPGILEAEKEHYPPFSTSKNEIIASGSVENISDSPKSSGCETQVLSIISREKNENSSTNKCPDDGNLRQKIPLSPLQQICKLLQSWVTENTKQYLMASISTENTDVHATAFLDPKIQRGYVDLCKRLDLQEQGVTDTYDELTGHKSNPSSRLQSIPDYKLLKEESEQFQLQVTEFITGKRVKDPKHSKVKKNSEDESPVYLPTVDIYDQMMIRAKIVLDRLDKTIPELLVPMGLTVQDVSTSLRELIYTFRLERDTIIFKPSEWTLVALILLQMLALKVQVIESAFRKDTAENYFNILLLGIGHTCQDLHVVVDSLLK